MTALAAPKPLSKSHHLASHLTDKTKMATQLSRRYEQLLISEKYHDCSFHFGGGTSGTMPRLKCHKLILAAASPVFEAMFFGPLRRASTSTTEAEVEEIEILDMSAELFSVLMRYIYAGEINFEPLTLEQTIELYYGAEKYLLGELIGDCLVAIRRKLRFANILPALELSVCLDLGELLDVCMTFFKRCCLGDVQYMAHLKTHYQHHVSKECIKALIAATSKEEVGQKQLLWFVYEWCQRECVELGLPRDNCAAIIDQLQLKEREGGSAGFDNSALVSSASQAAQLSIERSYYKATRPFTVDCDAREWKLGVQCDRFVALHGIVMHSRLAPNLGGDFGGGRGGGGFPSEYCENLSIEIRGRRQQHTPTQASTGSSDGSEDDDEEEEEEEEDVLTGSAHEAVQRVKESAADQVIWRHTITKQPTKYNCDLLLRWDEGVILSPDCTYELKLIWQSNAYGAEYPCSLLSNLVDGIQFRDGNAQQQQGSLIKGLRFLNLV